MDWNKDINLSKLRSTSRLIVERALVRGWRVASFETNPSILLLYIPDRKESIKIFSSSPPQMSYAVSKIAKDKFVTNQILAMNNITVPKELLISSKDKDEISKAEKFISENHKIVVKPLDASHGKGITMDVASNEDLMMAIDAANVIGSDLNILLQEQIQGIDVRVLCIGYEFVDAISRTPASVTGDGIHTIKELIEIINSSEERGYDYATDLNVILIDKVEEYLGREKLNIVPLANEEVQVIGVSNVGMGGTQYNIKSDIPDFLKDIAIQCSKELELPVCGVDFMVKRAPKNSDVFDDLRPCVVEVNNCPSLTMCDNSHSIEQDALIDRYLDYVASASRPL